MPEDVFGPLAHAYKELTPTFMRNHIAVFERYGIAPNDSSTVIQALRIALDGIDRRAAMLQAGDTVSGNSFSDLDLEGMSHGNNPQANAYRELMAYRRNSPVIPDGSKEALSEAVAAIYFTDSTDYLPALYSVVKALSPEVFAQLLSNEKAAFDATRLPAAPQEVKGE